MKDLIGKTVKYRRYNYDESRSEINVSRVVDVRTFTNVTNDTDVETLLILENGGSLDIDACYYDNDGYLGCDLVTMDCMWHG